MKRRHFILVCAAIILMMVWGFDIIAAIKYEKKITSKSLFSIFDISQIIYGTVTLIVTRIVFKKFYLQKRYISLALSILALIIFFVLLRYSLEEVLFPYFFGIRNYAFHLSFNYYFLDNIYYATIYITLGISVFFIDEYVHVQKRQSLLAEKNREAELAFLRSQINPHFLFNALNNIYSLSYKKSEKTSEAILKLSELMRYMLYEKKEMVPLEKEWEYLQYFIALQQLRWDYLINIRQKEEGRLKDWEIPAYLLIAFIENMIKHGDFSSNKEMIIELHVTPGKLLFRTKNEISYKQKDGTGGIGLENIKRRLNLIYPHTHFLEINTSGEQFTVNLEIVKRQL